MQQASDNAFADAFTREGYVVLRRFYDEAACRAVRAEVTDHLSPLLGPLEYEADVGYPGAPHTRAATGGDTPRRLLHAYARFPSLRAFASSPRLGRHLQALLGGEVALSQCHHNCVMTKHPGYSSATLWHQDIRYWSYDRPELVSVWLALGDEASQNGALKVIPGSHRLELDRGRFDRDLFLRTDLAANKALIRDAIDVTLAEGDVLLFHCRAFHAAGTNRTDRVKLSAVFTYHRGDNRPIPGTRSAQYPSITVET